ncbi:chitin synthase-domain-containing protein [Coemansia mojavensis]|nr:chitin synthase-domain-containing protein [Coemansia mojavensis]KAJ1741756.1 hypothetical protein LPJ68_002552 [Coemansia sp. RSA 1086]
MGTARPKSHEASPLTALEERVFREGETDSLMYNIFNDESVLKIYDSEDGEAPQAGHSRRLDNMIDKYGNRLGLRSKRLVRIVGHRKGPSGSAATPERALGTPSLGTSGRHSGHKRAGAYGSSSTASSSPMPGRLELESQNSGLVADVRAGGGVAKRRIRGHKRGLRGARLASISGEAAGSMQTPGESESFDATYSAGGSTSTILHRRRASDGGDKAGSMRGWRRWRGVLSRRKRSKSRQGGLARISHLEAALEAPPASQQQQQQQRQSHGGSNEAEKETERQRGPVHNAAHKAWAKIIEFVMPGGHNRFGQRDERSYRESIGFLVAFALASVAFIMWGTLVPKALCSTDQTFTLDDIEQRRFVAANGIVSDFVLARGGFGSTMRGYAGYDISSVFPMIGQYSPETMAQLSPSTASMLTKCATSQNAVNGFLQSWRENSTLFTGPAGDFPELCPFPQAPQTTGAACQVAFFPQFASSKVGVVKINRTEVKTKHSSPLTSWVVLDDMVYDVSQYVKYATSMIVVNGTVDSGRELRNESMFLPKELTQLFMDKAGSDITDDFEALDIDSVLYKQCLASLFLRGTTVTTKSPLACANTNIVAWVTFGLYFVVLLARMATAEVYARVRARRAVAAAAEAEAEKEAGARVPSVLVVVPCSSENIETLTGTLQSVARSAHADTHKLLWIVNDGDEEVLSSIQRIVAHSGRTSDAKFYGAYGVDGGGFGAARVFGGFYECGRRRIPYVVAAKDARQGCVDSLMMVLNLFRLAGARGEVSAPTIFLEEEVEARMAQLGRPASSIDYCLLLDARAQLDPLALTQFVARMERHSDIAALSGSLYPVGRPASLPHVLYSFAFHLQHFVAPICDSLSGATCPMDQLFCMYRVRLESGERCLGDDELVASMDGLMKGSVRFRHRTWPGNDCLLVPRIVRRFPHLRWAFEPNGRAEVALPALVATAFDPYERQWFRTRLVTLFDIVRGRVRRRALPVMLARLLFPFMVPAATCMLYLEIVISMFGDSPAIVVSELTAGFLAAAFLLLLLSRRWLLALCFLAYSAVALPFYYVWIPVTSFFSMNRVWYPPNQLPAAGAAVAPDNLEEIKLNYLRRFGPAHNGSRRSLSSQASSPHPAAFDNGDASSDSETEAIDHPHTDALGLSMPVSRHHAVATPLSPRSISVGSALMADTRTVLRQLLTDHRSVEPESAEFYALCEQVLRVLIPRYPKSSVSELAMAVNCAVDEVLPKNPSGASPVSPRSDAFEQPFAHPQSPFMYSITSKFSQKPSRYSGRPVSVIIEESDTEPQ